MFLGDQLEMEHFVTRSLVVAKGSGWMSKTAQRSEARGNAIYPLEFSCLERVGFRMALLFLLTKFLFQSCFFLAYPSL